MKGHSQDNINFLDDDGHSRSGRGGGALLRRFSRLRQPGLLRQSLTFTASVLVLLLLLDGANMLSAGLTARSRVLGAATSGVGHLREAENLLKQKNFTESAKQIESAKQSFQNAKQTMSSLGDFVNSLLSLSSQGKDAAALLDAGESISNAGLSIGKLYAVAGQIHFSPAGVASDQGLYQTLDQAKSYFAEANRYLTEADHDLAQVDPGALPTSMRPQFGQYKDLLDNSMGALQQSYDLFDLFQQFLGPGQKTVLVLFENDNELRPTGGFIGTYGYFKLDNGSITSQQIASVYDLDGQLRVKIAPPGPFHDLTDHWGLRDSNWFVNFPDSAKKAIDFYEQEAGETPDAIVAVTPQVFVDILQQTGPVDFPKYNLTLGADNFRRLVQLNTSVYYDKNLNAPKQMLADFAPLLLQKVASEPSVAPQILSALLNDLDTKQILLYDRNQAVQQRFAGYNWTGQIADTDRDYLAVYNGNLGGHKTDLDVSQNLNIDSEVQPDGSIVNTLTYTRTHKQSDDPGGAFANIDYARFLVPRGSLLLEASGFAPRSFHASDGSDYLGEPAASFTVDPDVVAVFGNDAVDPKTNVVIGSESGKTVFGGWIQTDPGQSSTVTLRYALPFNYGDSAKQSLLMQRQPGNNPVTVSYRFNGPKQIVWSLPNDLKISGGSADYNFSLISDTLIGFVDQ